MIEVRELSKSFGETVALDSVSFAARRGEILGVLGPNGAGKTTAMRIVCGYLPPSGGTASVDGIDVERDSLEVRRHIGFLPENNPLYPEMRVTEYLSFRAALKRVPRRERAARLSAEIDRCGLSGVARRTIGTLSKGFRQRVGLADALISRPPLLVLDEPTVGLDPNQVIEVRKLIRSLRGTHTVLLSSHYLAEIEQVCDRVVIFRHGQVIAEDSTDNLRARASIGSRTIIELPASDESRLSELTENLASAGEPERLADDWLRVELDSNHDPRAELFDRARKLGISLRELTRRRASLEDIFQELTGAPTEESDGAP